MTPQESTMLNDLVNKIQQTRLPEKDSEAESFLQARLGGNPDTLYILAQTVLVQNIALDRAQAQVKQLQEQVQQAQSQPQAQPHSTSFLGSLLGRRDPVPPPPPAPQSMGVPPPPPQYYPPAPAYAPNYAAAPPVAAPPPGGGGSSFLRSAATTAAGVAAGALAFEGVESLLHGFGHGGGFGGPEFGGGGFGGGAFGQRPVEETVVNNYYDDPNQSGMGDRREASFDDRSGDRFGGDQGMQLRDASYDTRGDEARDDLDRAQSSNDLQGIDTLDTDQTSGGFDDNSGYDDSDSFDDSGDDSNVL
jgi:hypothetical protein